MEVEGSLRNNEERCEGIVSRYDRQVALFGGGGECLFLRLKIYKGEWRKGAGNVW